MNIVQVCNRSFGHKIMGRSLRILCLALAAGFSLADRTSAAECVEAGLSPFSALARQIRSEPVAEGRDLLNVRLMQARDRARCRLAYRLDWLGPDGRLVSDLYDARSLRQIKAPSDLVWQVYRPEKARNILSLSPGTRSVVWTEVQ